MNKKRTSIFIVTLLLVSFVLTGCGTDAIGFFNHLNEMQKVSIDKPTQTVSRISVGDVEFPTEIIPADQKQTVQAITDFLDDYYIDITQITHPGKNITSISFDTILKLNKDLKKENLFTIKYKDEAFAISTGPKLSVLPQEIQAMINLFANQLIPLSAFEESLGQQPLAFSSISNRQGLLDMNEKSMAYLKEFGKTYRSMDTQFITKDPAHNGSFLFQMDTIEFADFLNEFVSISIQNTGAIIKTTSNFLESLTEEEFNLLYGQILPGGKAEMIALLKESIEMPIPEATPEIWTTMYNAEIKPVIINTMEGSSIRMRTWKEDSKYYTNLYGAFKISIPGEPNIKLASTILIKEESKVIADDFDITMPTVIMSDSLLKSILPSPIKIKEATQNIEVTDVGITP